MWIALGEDGTTIGEDAIDAAFRRWDDGVGSSYAVDEPIFETSASYERLHATGEIVSAILSAGLRLDLYEEFAVTPAPTPWLERRPDGLFHFPEGAFRFPLTYALRAMKPDS